MPKRQKQIIFCGCGGFYHYYIGVASVLQKLLKNHDSDEEIIYGGISAGCFTALALALNLDVDELFNRLNLPILGDVAKHKTGALFNFNHYVRKWVLEYLPPDSYQKASGKFRVSVTRVPSFTNEIVDTYTSNEDLIDSILCSAYVPVFELGLYKYHRGNRYVDGGATDLYGHKFLNLPNTDTLIIEKDKWRPTCANWFWCYTCENWAETLYNWGIQDAFTNQSELIEFLEGKQNDTGHLELSEIFEIIFGKGKILSK